MDLGLDLDRARNLPECAACRKKSDGAVTFHFLYGDLVSLCGTHYDEWLRSEPRSIIGRERLSPAELIGQFARLRVFVARLRRERYAACWDVPTDP
jgi:hypothetical protein